MQAAPSQLTIPAGPFAWELGGHSDLPTDTGRPSSFSSDHRHHLQSSWYVPASEWNAPCLVISLHPTKTLLGNFSYSPFTNKGTKVLVQLTAFLIQALQKPPNCVSPSSAGLLIRWKPGMFTKCKFGYATKKKTKCSPMAWLLLAFSLISHHTYPHIHLSLPRPLYSCSLPRTTLPILCLFLKSSSHPSCFLLLFLHS